jgi:hypothetical protein
LNWLNEATAKTGLLIPKDLSRSTIWLFWLRLASFWAIFPADLLILLGLVASFCKILDSFFLAFSQLCGLIAVACRFQACPLRLGAPGLDVILSAVEHCEPESFRDCPLGALRDCPNESLSDCPHESLRDCRLESRRDRPHESLRDCRLESLLD